MKKHIFFLIASLLAVSAALWIAACQKEIKNAADAGEAFSEDRNNQNSMVYPPNASPNGKSYSEWSAEWLKWNLAIPCATNPAFDPTGANAGINQNGPVYFLAGTAGGSVTRNVTIPHGKKILFPIVNYINDYPCPDPNFQPAPGQTLEDFLAQGAADIMDQATALEVTLDGVAFTNLAAYRFQTGLFYFTGDPNLTTCLDPCITGEEQAGVGDGYYIMLKPLSHGQHTLHFHAEDPGFGIILDVTFNITVP